MKHPLRVPPSPSVMAMLYMEYIQAGKPQGLTFPQYLSVIGYTNPAHNLPGMDDSVDWQETDEGPELLRVPSQPVVGNLHVKVLLVDFADRHGHLPRHHYENLLFSQGVFPWGSMYDYYREISLNKVSIQGTVHGWLRLPEPYSTYTNDESGLEPGSYPRNAQRMAEDAVHAALNAGISFEPHLDALGQKTVTALFIVHAGLGAEGIHWSANGKEMWSHKWTLHNPIQVAPDLKVTKYLTVPHNGEIGVCCHELGHLAFQWQDFYDPDYKYTVTPKWSGTGVWDLMAGGSYNGCSRSPAHPAALHKLQHGWIDVQDIAFREGEPAEVDLEIEPYTADTGKVYRVRSPKYQIQQYLLLENRVKFGFDAGIPGEGLLVWRVDENERMVDPNKPGLLLLQADGLRQLEARWSKGDAGDPFPGTSGRTTLESTGTVSTSFPGQTPSGLSLVNIEQIQGTRKIRLKVRYDGS